MTATSGKTGEPHPTIRGETLAAGTRIRAIDALRGLVMILMLVDHVRETFLLHIQVSDPVDVHSTSPSLFFTRLTSTFCAPAFILLTGLGAWLFSQKYSRKETSLYLLKRGIFLVVLELTVINPAWATAMPSEKIYLQVIWCIGLSMIALSALIHIPRKVQLILALALISGHHLLEGIHFQKDSFIHTVWNILYQRDWIDLGHGMAARTSYPILPWIGVILLGYNLGTWYDHEECSQTRVKKLCLVGAMMVFGFAVLRVLNCYGDKPWQNHEEIAFNAMAFLALTKYPPSLLFLLFTLGFSAIALGFLEKYNSMPYVEKLANFGSAPMFFYVVHLYILKLLYFAAISAHGANHGEIFGFSHVIHTWVISLVLFFPLYFMTCHFARLKRRSQVRWLRYF